MQLPRRRRPEFDETRIYEYPQHLREAIEDLPSAPGVYIFHGEEGDLPLYIGKSVNLRSRVLSHLRNADEARLLRQTKRISHIRGRFVFDDRKGGFDSSTGVGVAP
jgi:excinuclease Cho